MVVNVLHSSHYRIINYVDFESIIYTINLNVMSFSKIYSEFDFIFLSNILLF